MASELTTIRGLDGLLDALKALPPEISSKNGGPARVALAKGARVVRDEVRRRAPKDSGALVKNVIMQRDRNPQRSGANERYLIGVRGGAKNYANTKRNVRKGRAGKEYKTDGNTYYWRFKEFGTKKMPADPFLRPAFESKKEEAMNVIASTLASGIERAAKKVAGLG